MAKQDSLQEGPEFQRHSKHTEVNVNSFFHGHFGMLQISTANYIEAVEWAVLKD